MTRGNKGRGTPGRGASRGQAHHKPSPNQNGHKAPDSGAEAKNLQPNKHQKHGNDAANPAGAAKKADEQKPPQHETVHTANDDAKNDAQPKKARKGLFSRRGDDDAARGKHAAEPNTKGDGDVKSMKDLSASSFSGKVDTDAVKEGIRRDEKTAAEKDDAVKSERTEKPTVPAKAANRGAPQTGPTPVTGPPAEPASKVYEAKADGKSATGAKTPPDSVRDFEPDPLKKPEADKKSDKPALGADHGADSKAADSKAADGKKAPKRVAPQRGGGDKGKAKPAEDAWDPITPAGAKPKNPPAVNTPGSKPAHRKPETAPAGDQWDPITPKPNAEKPARVETPNTPGKPKAPEKPKAPTPPPATPSPVAPPKQGPARPLDTAKGSARPAEPAAPAPLRLPADKPPAPVQPDKTPLADEFGDDRVAAFNIDDDFGSNKQIKITEKVIGKVVNEAIKSVPGTVTTSGGVNAITGRNYPRNEIKLGKGGDAIAVDAYIAVGWPAPVAHVAEKARQTIITWIHDMTDVPVVQANVTVGAVEAGHDRTTIADLERFNPRPTLGTIRVNRQVPDVPINTAEWEIKPHTVTGIAASTVRSITPPPPVNIVGFTTGTIPEATKPTTPEPLPLAAITVADETPLKPVQTPAERPLSRVETKPQQPLKRIAAKPQEKTRRPVTPAAQPLARITVATTPHKKVETAPRRPLRRVPEPTSHRLADVVVPNPVRLHEPKTRAPKALIEPEAPALRMRRVIEPNEVKLAHPKPPRPPKPVTPTVRSRDVVSPAVPEKRPLAAADELLPPQRPLKPIVVDPIYVVPTKVVEK